MSKRRRTPAKNQQSTLATVLAILLLLLIFWLFPDVFQEDPTMQPGDPPTRGQPATSALNLALGNPSNATADTRNPTNYLIERDQYVLSYNRDGGIPNWASWHLSAADLGTADRSDFQPDPDLPPGWYRVRPSDYSNSGYDRGHMVPSADRTLNEEDNQPLFYMTNIVPQAPDNNQGPWVELEEYCRTLARAGNELYIVGGGYGSRGTLRDGRITIPSSLWKVIVVLPEGDDDLRRIGNATEVITVDMPNRQGIRGNDWRTYLASVDQIEESTGYDLLSNVDPAIQQLIEARVAAP